MSLCYSGFEPQNGSEVSRNRVHIADCPSPPIHDVPLMLPCQQPSYTYYGWWYEEHKPWLMIQLQGVTPRSPQAECGHPAMLHSKTMCWHSQRSHTRCGRQVKEPDRVNIHMHVKVEYLNIYVTWGCTCVKDCLNILRNFLYFVSRDNPHNHTSFCETGYVMDLK